MTYRIVVEPEALNDLMAIYKYISEQDSRNKATKFTNELKETLSSLSEMPHRCRKSLYVDQDDVRDLIYKGYTIVFQIRENTIHILTLFRQRVY
jgi:toxin ParE1/3/4